MFDDDFYDDLDDDLELGSGMSEDDLLTEALEVVLATKPSLANDFDRLVDFLVDAVEDIEEDRLARQADRRRAQLAQLVDAYEAHQRAQQADGGDLQPDTESKPT